MGQGAFAGTPLAVITARRGASCDHRRGAGCDHCQGREAESVGEGAFAGRAESVAEGLSGFDASASWASLGKSETIMRMAGGWRGGEILNGYKNFRIENGSSQEHNRPIDTTCHGVECA